MNEVFYLFFYDNNLKDLLLEEIKLKYPELNLSFSNKEFISMKGPNGLEAKLTRDPIIFAQRQALFLEKSDIEVTNSSVLVGRQYWVYKIIKGHCDTYNYLTVDTDEVVPARAYHKMEQAHRLFDLDIQAGDSIIEIGSAPGGISYYLLNLQTSLVSIDPALMADILFEKFPKSFSHLKESVFEVRRKDLPKKCDWLISDLNLAGDINVNQAKRIMDMYPEIKGAFLTVKTPKLADLKKIGSWLKVFNSYDILPVHLPAHRREIGLIISSQ